MCVWCNEADISSLLILNNNLSFWVTFFTDLYNVHKTLYYTYIRMCIHNNSDVSICYAIFNYGNNKLQIFYSFNYLKYFVFDKLFYYIIRMLFKVILSTNTSCILFNF